jgi:hypothetical protein
VREERYARRDSETGRPNDRSDPRPRPACDRIGSRSSCPRHVSSQRRVIRQADGGGLASSDVLHHGLLPERPIARPRSLPEASKRRSRLLDMESRDEDNAGTPFNCRFVRFRRVGTDVVCDQVDRRTDAAAKQARRFRRPRSPCGRYRGGGCARGDSLGVRTSSIFGGARLRRRTLDGEDARGSATASSASRHDDRVPRLVARGQPVCPQRACRSSGTSSGSEPR